MTIYQKNNEVDPRQFWVEGRVNKLVMYFEGYHFQLVS